MTTSELRNMEIGDKIDLLIDYRVTRVSGHSWMLGRKDNTTHCRWGNAVEIAGDICTVKNTGVLPGGN